jgi:AraC-like DNA-binding protein
MDMPQLAFRVPAAAPSGVVSTYYWVDSGSHALDDTTHPEWANVRFTLKGSWTVQRLGQPVRSFGPMALFGPSSCGARVSCAPGSALVGFGLLPMGWARLVGGPARRLADDAVPLQAEWPKAEALHAACLAATTLDQWAAVFDRVLLARLAISPPAPALLVRAHEVLLAGDIATVDRYAEAVGVSVRTLERLCGTLFGFGPKTLLRRQRFLNALDQMMRQPEPKPGDLLPEGYADQSHFIHEFKAFMGTTPGRYLASPRIVMQRAAAQRAALFGQSLQGLHAPA